MLAKTTKKPNNNEPINKYSVPRNLEVRSGYRYMI